MKLSKNEQIVLEVLWNHLHLANDRGEIYAKELSDLITKNYGWPKTSNYSYFNRLVKKGALKRGTPGYTLKAMVTVDEIEIAKANKLIDDVFKGSVINFFSAFIGRSALDDKELKEIEEVISQYQSK